jgi:hypothetical protein
MGWSISPSDGASINSSGVATFTKDGTFTITYTDSNGCTGSTTYTASGCGEPAKTDVTISLSCSLNSSNTTLTITANASRSVDTAVSVTVTGNLNLKNSGGISFSTTLTDTITIAAGSSSESDSYDADDFAGGVSFIDASCSISSLSPTSSSSQNYIKGSGCSCSGGGGTDTISFRGHNCTSEYGTIEVVSITLSDGSTVSCGVAEAVNAGGEEHLGTVDVTGKTGKSITSANVTFNGTSIGSAGISGTITDGAEFTATAGDCGEPGPTCDCSGVEMTASITATSEEGSEGTEGNYPKDCTSRMSYTAPDWVTIRFENGGIMVDHAKNTTTSQRSGTIIIKMDGTTCKTATITQQAGSGSPIHYTANVNCSSSVDADKVCVKFANEAEECGGNTYSYSTTAKSCSVSIRSSDSSIYIVSPSTVTLTESSPSYDFEVRNKVVLSAVNASRDSSDLRLRLSAQGEPNCSGQIDLGIKFAYKPPTSDEAVWETTSVNVNIDDFNGQEMDITDEIHRDLPAGSYVWPDDVSVTSHTFSDTGGDTYDCSDGCTYYTF